MYLAEVYRILFGQWGPQGWWPGQTRLEIIVGAILTQNTAWTNVEKAIRRLKQERALDLKVLRAADNAVLAEWIRSAGYFNVKARRLKCQRIEFVKGNPVHPLSVSHYPGN